MNVKYFKRQLILKDFGIPMSEDVQKMYNYFMSIIGDINEYEVYNEIEMGYSDNLFWLKDGNIIFRFNTKRKNLWISASIYYDFSNKWNLDDKDFITILVYIVEDFLDIYAEDLANYIH